MLDGPIVLAGSKNSTARAWYFFGSEAMRVRAEKRCNAVGRISWDTINFDKLVKNIGWPNSYLMGQKI